MNILIVGASGNLGSQLTKHLLTTAHRLRLLTHKRPLPFALPTNANAEIVRADLDDPASLRTVCEDIDCIVYLAGVLFQPRPEKFLHRTNTVYAQNLIDAATAGHVKKFILVSFPHVEENTTPDNPAKGELHVEPKSLHARTRLAAEKYLFDACAERSMTPIVLRAGVIYGREVKLIEAARWLMRWRLMAIWRAPVWLHLLALPDFLNIVRVAIDKENLSGIYNLCDDQPLLLQDFLDRLAEHWGYPPARRLPEYCFHAAAAICETVAAMCHSGTPLTHDMIAMGMTSVVADTSRMKRELVGQLAYPTLHQGITIL
ncbi:MAG: NAD(P)-dependent oxidoreductase [Deltaproteobacteria bacterium]|nr:NAD(P)-dependent oxidoreductase [Deltaproteobacteria bacterium]